ncbi:MAG: ATP-dependent 6-phosphofructokinase, partial [Ilumatobacter sp.]|nr:ATP-dependent 6-phosphofructokinase [Ilumatobacter sp.]
MRVGILTGGGDCPGLNAVIRAAVRKGERVYGDEMIGFLDAWDGVRDRRTTPLSIDSMRGMLPRGGTVLGTRRGSPFDTPDGVDHVKQTISDLGLDGLIVIGGNGSLSIACRLHSEHGLPILGVPKTIDNDIEGTDLTFGFTTAVQIATDAIDRLHTTAESHDRVILLEVMGRDAGHIALHAGIAGGADCIVIPEIPYDPDRICAKVMRRRSHGRQFTIIIVAEGAVCASGETPEKRSGLSIGGPSLLLAEQIKARIEAEVRVTVLGHIQRGGTPCAYDRLLSTRYGAAAVDLVEQ